MLNAITNSELRLGIIVSVALVLALTVPYLLIAYCAYVGWIIGARADTSVAKSAIASHLSTKP
jgi:hypothetical protein